MLTRILFYALAIICGIFIVRFVRAWIATLRQGSEISGKWEVLPPLKKASSGRIEQLGTMLDISDVTGLHAIAMVLEIVDRSINGPEMDPSELKGLLGPGHDPNSVVLFEGDSPLPAGWLVVAADLVRDYRPELSAYEARKGVRQAFGAVFTINPPLLAPDTQPARVPNAPPVPPIDQRYMHFMFDNFDGNGDHDYEELCSEEHDSALPEGAMLPLIHLLIRCDNEESANVEISIPVSDLLKRYGVRLFPAVVAYFGNPKRSTDEQQEYGSLFDLICEWPQETAEPIFRAALESGWNESVNFLPDDQWAMELKKEFADSPYGPPES